MLISHFQSNEEILCELGTRVKDARISFPLTQAQLAARAGVSTRTVTSLESGDSIKLNNLLNILRALNLISNIETLVPEQGPRPEDVARLGKKRMRARPAETLRSEYAAWKWGDE